MGSPFTKGELVTVNDWERLKAENKRLRDVVQRIHADAVSELARIEQHGGCCGFALRIEGKAGRALE